MTNEGPSKHQDGQARPVDRAMYDVQMGTDWGAGAGGQEMGAVVTGVQDLNVL